MENIWVHLTGFVGVALLIIGILALTCGHALTQNASTPEQIGVGDVVTKVGAASTIIGVVMLFAAITL